MVQDVGRSPAEAGSGHSPKGGARKRSPAKPSVPNAIAAIDLRRDLPKVRAQLPAVLKAQEAFHCDYTAPCVIGAMVPPGKRKKLQGQENALPWGDTTASNLLKLRLLDAPSDQRRNIVSLQNAFDSGDQKRFLAALDRAERKWLSA